MLENGVVRTPNGFKAAFDTLREGGWMALDATPEYGGQGLPYLMHTAVNETFVSANMAFNMYQGLTHGAYSAIKVHGTDAQKQEWLPKMVCCEWTGTMNLTEPHCGTDLGMMRTKAEPQADGSYKITGQKISSRPATTTWRRTSCIWCWPRPPAAVRGRRGFPFSSCRR